MRIRKTCILLWMIVLIMAFFLKCDHDNLSQLTNTSYEAFEVSNITPSEDASGVATNSSITISFSRPINASSFLRAFSLSNVTLGKVLMANYNINWSLDHKTVSITLIDPSNTDVNFAPSAIYNIAISTALRSTDGSPFISSYHSSFATGEFADTTTPTLDPNSSGIVSGTSLVTNPTDGLYPVNGVQFKFSEAMNKETVNFAYSCTINSSPRSPTLSELHWYDNDTRLVIDLDLNCLPEKTKIDIRLDTNVAQDLGSNSLSNSTLSYSFKTGGNPNSDIYEPNNTLAQADVNDRINVGEIINANIHNSWELDYYKIFLKVNKNYRIILSNIPSGTNYDIAIFHASKPEHFLVYSYNTGTHDEVITFTPERSYYYYIKVFSVTGYSPNNYRLLVALPPDPPRYIDASDGTYTDRIIVTWEAISGATSYNIYRTSYLTYGDGPVEPYVKVGSTISTSFTDNDLYDLEPDRYYYYKISSCNSNGESTLSTTWATGSRKTPTPAGLTVRGSFYDGKSNVRLAWTQVTGASCYRIYRANSLESSYSKIEEVSKFSYSFRDFSATPGLTYWYKVRARGSLGGYSAYSEAISGTAP